ncbi:hypothetical protein DUI87_19255 [Hirundo rustica rustica]|uniref:RNase H type-1 domain-containing protein n=1 Tax=Hirundo rustica rustica TaxID=333673 RepID=A0A3M0JSK7_HIRRU|nr:hypothetical protein DUI87_19255 [Hirundo rustica rustica]
MESFASRNAEFTNDMPMVYRIEPSIDVTVFITTPDLHPTGKAIVTWQDGSEWQALEGHEDGSAQLVELKAAVMAFEKFSQEPFNLITDSTYVADIAQQLGCSVLKEALDGEQQPQEKIQETMVTLWQFMEPKGCWDTPRPSGTKESIVAVQNQGGHFNIMDSNGTKVPLLYNRTSWNQGAIVKLWDVMESRTPLIGKSTG